MDDIDAQALARLILAAARCPDGDPDQATAIGPVVIGTAEVARMTGYKPSTIRAWVARNHPRGNPFPHPAQDRERNHWDKAEVEAWMARQPRLPAQRPAPGSHL